MKKVLLTAAAVSLIAGGASAATFNFEGLLGATEDFKSAEGQDFGDFTVSSPAGEEAFLIRTGGNGLSPSNPSSTVDGFVPNDTPIGDFGDVFLSGDFIDNTELKLTFDKVVRGLSFEIADIDGSGNQTEMFTFSGLLGGLGVQTINVSSGDAGTGDAVVTTITFLNDIDELIISASTNGGSRNIGWGVDNMNYEVVPLPAGLVLTLTALGGLGVMRARRKS